VSADRQVSVVDPEMRHGRKSKSRKFNGYKGTVTADATSGVITAVHVMAANEHDSAAVVPIIEQQACSGTQPPALIGDRAYAAEEARHVAMSQGVAIVTKPNTPGGDKFGKRDFEIDWSGGTVTCPNGCVRAIGGQSITFTGKGCPLDCPHRRVCLGRNGKRIIKLRKYEALQQDAENFAQTDRGRELLLLRPAIERVIAHWMRNGARQARYFGRLKVWMQCMLSAIMCNVRKIVDKVDTGGSHPSDIVAKMPASCFAWTLMAMLTTISNISIVLHGLGRRPRPSVHRTVWGFKKALSSGDS